MTLQHRPHEDIQALLVSVFFVGLGVHMFVQLGLLTGGTAGLAFVVHYATGWDFGPVFFLVNLPFYLLALRRMGKAFTLKSFTAVTLLSMVTQALPHWMAFSYLNVWLGALLGGVLIGTGMLILFRHGASLGGLNVLVLWLQDKKGWNAGRLQMGIDCTIVAVASALVTWDRLLLSIAAAVAMNLVLALNHRKGRYVTMD